MDRKFSLKSAAHTFLNEKSGNFGILTALLLPVLLGVGGASFEVARALMIKRELQNSVDAATLLAATQARLTEGKASEAQLKNNARKLIQSIDLTKDLEKDEKKKWEETISVNATKEPTPFGFEFEISANVQYTMKLNPLLKFINHDTLTVGASSTAKSSYSKGAALSMYVVFDRSGSMSFKTTTKNPSKTRCPNYTSSNWGQSLTAATSEPCYYNKMDSLKTAVEYLTQTLNEADPTYNDKPNQPQSSLVRVGGISYADSTSLNLKGHQVIDWGTEKVKNYTNAVDDYPKGGTDAYSPLVEAWFRLRKSNPTEAEAHEENGSKNFERFILFMTDGEMTGNSSYFNASIDKNVRNTCDAIKADGIQIYTIAFVAPARGKSLLQHCSSSNSHYYEPDNMQQLVEVFGEIARKTTSVISSLSN